MSDTPHYLIAQLEITDFDAFRSEYVEPLQPINARYGAKPVIGTPAAEVKEGSYGPNFTAVLEFPSKAALDGWYADPDYAPLIEARKRLTNPDTSILLSAPAYG